MKVLFWYEKSNRDASSGSVSCSVLIKDTKEAYFSTKLAVNKADWGGNNDRFLKSHKGYQADNTKLGVIEGKLNEIYNNLLVVVQPELIDPKMIVTAYKFFENPENAKLRPDKDGLKAALLGKYNLCPTLLEVLEAHKKNKTRFVEKDTVTTYKTRIKNMEAFLVGIKKKNFPADEFRVSWCKKFCDWMYDQGMHVNHVARHISFYREALDEAVDREEIAANPMGNFSVKRDDTKDLRHLHPREVETLENLDFAQTHNAKYAAQLGKARDIFLFLVYTGFHISDYLDLTIDHVQTRKSGLWLIKPRNKTNQKAHIKVEGKLLELYTKYGGVRGLPKMHKNDVNDCLKVIEQMCGFKVNGLSTKIGRKTAANKMLNHDVIDKDSIALIMGLKTTRHIDDYAEMNILRLENKDV